MAHDQVFKALLREFLREFLLLFYPDVAARLDFTRVTFLDKELFTDLLEGDQREIDLLVQVYTLDGEPELLLIHIEVQAKRERNFGYRMYEYHALLRMRFRLPVFPLAVYLAPGAGDVSQETYTERVLGYDVLTFRYNVVSLPDKSADDYLDVDNPLAPALAALMKPSGSGRALQKYLSLLKTVESEENEARKSLLTYVIETYLPLNATEEATFQELITQPGAEEVRTMWNIYEERGIAKGIEQGIARGIEQGIPQGILRGQRQTLLTQLTAKFGAVPEAIQARIQSLDKEEELNALSVRVLTANSLEEMGLTDDGKAS